MPAQLARRALENHPRRLHRQRRHRIRLRPRRIERAGSRQAGNANLPFYFGVVRLEVRVRDWPIRETGSRNWADLAALHEIDLVEPPEIRREVYARPAYASPIHERALRLGFFVWSLSKLVRLEFRMVGGLVLGEDFDFIMRKIRFPQALALLQHHNAKPVRRKFLAL